MDQTFLPDKAINQQTFFANDSASYQVWTKPKGISMVYLWLLGGGGSGGAGTTGSTASARAGGGGGGGGAVVNILVPAAFLPVNLYIQPGVGGTGTTPGSNGTSGGASEVHITGGGGGPHRLTWAPGGTNGGRGNAGTGGGSGAGGVHSAVPSANYGFSLGLGIWTVGAGIAGTAAGNVTAAAVAGATATHWTGGGYAGGGAAGGGTGTSNTDAVGGNIVAPFGDGPDAPMAGDLLGGIAVGAAGQHGGATAGLSAKPLMFVAGSGGASSSAGAAGFGGNGGYGGGGGGGGGGITGGNGGNGGGGLVIITCW